MNLKNILNLLDLNNLRIIHYLIFMWTYAYDLSIDGKQIQTYPFNNLEPLRRFDRSYKLKKILG